MNALMAGVSTNNDALRYAATRRPPTSPHSDDDGGDDEETAGGTSRLRDLIALLNARDKLYRGQGLQLFKLAYIQNMKYKVERYTELARRAEEEVEKHKEVLDIKVPGLKVAAGVTDDSDNWHIFESVSEQYLAAKDRAAAFVAMADRARARLWGSMGKETVQTKDEIRSIRDRLVLSLEKLSNYSAQEHIVEKTVELVESFIKDPRLFRTKLMNFMLLGGAGTGKSTIAEAIGEVFSHAGIFVGDRLITAGRAELVGQYEGQTVTKTRDFLTSNLDAGVIFIDEAYAITPWQNGKPEGYGSEAATAMVEFMTRYAGLYCIIVAGYEREMTRYFLPCNDGLSRRFPNKYVLNAMSADDLVHVFARALLTAQGRYVPHGRATQLESYDYFDDESWQYLRKIVDECLQGTVEIFDDDDSATRRVYRAQRRFIPRWTRMYELFKNQAGSMTNLAEEAINRLMRTISFKSVIAIKNKNSGVDVRPNIRTQDATVMRDIIVGAIRKSSLAEYDEFIAEFERVEQRLQTS